MGTLLELAQKIAARAHAGQIDQAGRAHIDHVLRVAHRQVTETAVAAALLHDTLEDSCVTAQALLAKGIPAEVVFDQIDNMNLTRLPIVTVNDAVRNEKYAKALQYLLAVQA